MLETDLKQEIWRQLDSLSLDKLQRIRAYVQSVTDLPEGTVRDALVALGGDLTPDEANGMRSAVEEEFGQVDHDGM